MSEGRIWAGDLSGGHGMIRVEILAAASDILVQRETVHGSAEVMLARIAALWSADLGVPISAADVARMMALLKLARTRGNPVCADSWIDLAGYAALGAELAGARVSPAPREFPETPPAPDPARDAVSGGVEVSAADLIGHLLMAGFREPEDPIPEARPDPDPAPEAEPEPEPRELEEAVAALDIEAEPEADALEAEAAVAPGVGFDAPEAVLDAPGAERPRALGPDEPDAAGWSLRQDRELFRLRALGRSDGSIAMVLSRKPPEIRARARMVMADYGMDAAGCAAALGAELSKAEAAE